MPPNRALCSVTQEPVSIGGQIICDHRIAKIRPFGSRLDPGRRAVIGGFLSKRPSDHKISCSLALPSMSGSAGNWSWRRGRPTGPPTGHRMSSGEDRCGHADEFIRPPVPQNLLGTRRPLRKIRRRFDPDPVRGCGIDRQAIGRRGRRSLKDARDCYSAAFQNERTTRAGKELQENYGIRGLERVKGIEPSYSAWKAAALPLSYTRMPF